MLVKPRRDVDIYHETYYSMADNCPRSAKRVITVFDMIHEKFPEYFSTVDETREIKAHVVSHADHCICISENTRQDLINLLGVPEEKTSVVHLGYSLSGRPEHARQIKRDSPFILYVGSRDKYKNFRLFLSAFSASPLLREKFSIICFGGGALTTKELEQIDSLGLSVQQVSGSDDLLAGLYASAATLVYPSLYEGFGIPLLEAMAYHCPVVCSSSSSLPEVVGDAAEFFDPLDEISLCQAIERVVSSPEHADMLAHKGKERIRGFSWEKCAQNTLQIYRKILQD